MQPIYRSDRAEVWHADARDVLAGMTTESVDLVVTDPPYGAEWRSNLRAEQFDMLTGDGSGDRDGIRAIIGETVRLVGQHRHLYVFGPVDVLEGHKVADVVSLVWDKGMLGAGDLTAAWGPQHEPISFTVSKHRHAGQTGADTVPTRLRKGSVLRFGRPTGRKVRHPSEKPVALLRELVESSSRQGELILDPFAGIGSTGVAAILSGRRAVLIEIDRRFADIAVDRVRAAERLHQQATEL